MTQTRLTALVGFATVAVVATALAIADVHDTGVPFKPAALGMDVPVLTSPKDLDRYAGQLVAIRGIIDHDKAPTIPGVFVRNPKELHGVDAYSIGILGRFKSKPDDNATLADPHATAYSPYPAVSYTLYFDLSGTLAVARPWADHPTGG